jgi:hypothetical protein
MSENNCFLKKKEEANLKKSFLVSPHLSHRNRVYAQF